MVPTLSRWISTPFKGSQSVHSSSLRSANATARQYIECVCEPARGCLHGYPVSAERVTLPSGASTETVAVPIVSSVAAPGPMPIIPLGGVAVAVRHHSERRRRVGLYSSPDATPPTITSVQLVTQGEVASAVVLGSAKISASVAGSDIGPRPALTRKGGQRCPMFRVRSYAVAGDSRSSCSRARASERELGVFCG